MLQKLIPFSKTLFKTFPLLQPPNRHYFCSNNTQTPLHQEVESKVFDILKTAAKCNQEKLSRKASFE